jgi:ribonuclease P/MRP protein subunit RPP40
MDVLYTDFSKAFDKVSHTKLLTKLKGYGLEDRLLKCIKAFLENRRQKLFLGEVESEWGEVTSVVPQGSVLGPTLFIIFINDLLGCLENTCKLYADDGKVFVENEKSNLQRDIHNTAKWCEVWSMALNFKKCKIMHFGKSNLLRNYEIMDGSELINLEKTESERDLGIIISSNGKTSEQVRTAVSKATRILGLMRKTFRFFNKELYKLLYPTFIRPHLEFSS